MPLLLPSKWALGPPFPLGSFTMAESLLHRVGGRGRQEPAGSQTPEWQGQVRGAAFPRRIKATGGERAKAPTGWLHIPQLKAFPSAVVWFPV